MAQVTQTQASTPRPRHRALAAAIAFAIGCATLPAIAQDPAALLQQAREAAWAGRTGEALHLIEKHLAEHPDDRSAHLEQARWLAWRGDYAGAVQALDALGGDDDEARALRARVMAWAGRRDAALMLNAPLYQAKPDDYDTAWTQSLAERLGERPELALPALATVQRVQPESKDTLALAKAVRLPLYSSIGVPAAMYEDSDDIEIRNWGLSGDLRVGDAVRLLADVMDRSYEAPSTSPFAPAFGGGDTVDETRIGIGARVAATPGIAFEASVGRSELEFDNGPNNGETIGRLLFTQRATDTFGYGLGYVRDRVAYSPRSLSLGIMRNSGTADLRFTPTLRDTIAVQLGADNFSDGNHRHAVNADWRHAIVRNGTANVDLGVQAEWLGFTDQPNTGYYSPDNYRRIAPVMSSYIALGPEAALYASVAIGVQRDETFENWKRASDVGLDLTLGIFSHWQLVASGAYTERLNEFGRYTGTSFGLSLRYRFCEFRADRCP